MKVDAVVAQAEKLNIEITKRIVKRFQAHFEAEGEYEFMPSSINDIVKLRNAGVLQEEIEQLVKDALPGLEKEVADAFRMASRDIEARLKTTAQDIIADNSADLPADASLAEGANNGLSEHEKRLITRNYAKTRGTMRNLTGTLAGSANRAFIEACDTAMLKVTHGVSMRDAILEGIQELAGQGAYIIYPSGRKDRIETALERAVRTGLAQANGDVNLAYAYEIGCNQVLVSSHLGARYTDKVEPANHMSWQGKVYDLDWDMPVLSKYKPQAQTGRRGKGWQALADAFKKLFARKRDRSAGDFVTVTGYGTGEGLCGWNCRHTFNIFNSNVMHNTQPEYDSDENKRAYDLEQKQRTAERNLRKLKREKIALQSAYESENDEQERERLKQLVQKKNVDYRNKLQQYNEWCKANGLRSKTERLRIIEEERRRN